MSIFSGADLTLMSLQLSPDPWPPDNTETVAMRLLAEGVPLALLVDLAVPPGPDIDDQEGTDRAARP